VDFFSHQEEARRRSRSLLWRFVLANLLLAAILTVLFCFVGVQFSAHRSSFAQKNSWSGEEFLPFALILDLFVLLTVSGAAGMKFFSLSSSSGAVAESLGGRKVSLETTDPLERRYVNVVSEMAIAANTPVPEVYVLDDQQGINAFASGSSPERSAVAVTRGALERLTREELQGVVAHEFSHILHGDVRLNIRLAAYIYGLVVLTAIGRFLLELIGESSRHRSRSSDKERNGIALVAGALALFFLMFGLLGRLVSTLMKAAVSREREFLADATAVQLTRNPDGLAGALKKIGGLVDGSLIQGRNAEALSHFFLANSNRRSFLQNLYSTHPPLLERIKRLDPAFQGDFRELDVIEQGAVEDEQQVSRIADERRILCQAELVASLSDPLSRSERHTLHEAWMPPDRLAADFVEVGNAQAVVAALLLSSQPVTRERQLTALAGIVPILHVEREHRLLSQLSLNQQLSAVYMALPTIQGGSRRFKEEFLRAVVAMIKADEVVTLTEILIGVLIHFATSEKDPSFTMLGVPNNVSLAGVSSAVERVLSVCVHFSSPDLETQRRLFQTAAAQLNIVCRFQADAHTDVLAFFESLQLLRAGPPRVRAHLMRAFRSIAEDDGSITEHEMQLLRLSAVLLRSELPE
jgi:Zn-dependent protease with chaperone function